MTEQAAAHASKLDGSPKRGFLDPFFAPGSGREIIGQLLQTPQVVHPAADVGGYSAQLCSLEEQASAPFLTTSKIRAFANALRAPPNDLRVSPLLAPSHAALPPPYVQVFGLDPLRDEGQLYSRLLREAGVDVQLHTRYPGCPHGFNMVFPEAKAAVKVDQDLRAGIDCLLSLCTWKKRSSSVCQIA
ncbi:hypothetical protein BV20DRAFT_1123505 [Pilatotrama ljubarskyi]|nr:hypothetical protein BV20DRAFT_1123505 [Pilatotrama ljubarskyi]